jgi:ribosomal protein S12 methylthiotransferase
MPVGKSVRLGVISLGCPKNLVDTERALGQLAESGVVIVEELTDADWVLINTCGFIEDAKTESLETILEVARLKESNPSLKIAVAGCLAERYGEALAVELGEVDFFTGVLKRENVGKLYHAMTGKSKPARLSELSDSGRLRITPPHIGYLRISEGCDNRCAYCIIPDIRGGLVSRPMETVIQDAVELVSAGAVELNVIAQDTTAYGLDLYGEKRLAQLLVELRKVNPKGWVRLLYAHPRHLGEDVIEVLASGAPFVRYVDLPLQHISDPVLKKMGRKVSRKQIEALIVRIRERIPEVFIRTAFIVGFPGETEEQFEELIDFVKATRFERLGAFEYSREEGSAAAAFGGQVSAKEKKRRLDKIMSTQKKIALDFNKSLVGKIVAGIVDQTPSGDDCVSQGRTYGDAPDVDGTALIRGVRTKEVLVKMRLVGVEEYDMLAEVVE